MLCIETHSINPSNITMLFKVTSIFLYFNFVTSVLMDYIHVDNPILSLNNGISSYSDRILNRFQRQPYLGFSQQLQKINNYDHIIDSHFQLLNSPPTVHVLPKEKKRIEKVEILDTESPLQEETYTRRSLYSRSSKTRHNILNQNVSDLKNKLPRGREHKTGRNGAVHMKSRIVTKSEILPEGQNYQQRNTEKQSFIRMNIYEDQIPNDLQKIMIINSDRQPTYTVYPVKNNYQVHFPKVLYKTVHKGNSFSRHNARTFLSVPDVMSRTTSDNIYKSEHKKRNIAVDSDEKIYGYLNYKGMSENIRTYKNEEKDKNMNKDTVEPGTVDNERTLDYIDIPYAVFHRTNPQELNRFKDFIVIRSVAESEDKDEKQKSLIGRFDNEMVLKRHNIKKNVNADKFHKRMKKFYNHKNVRK